MQVLHLDGKIFLSFFMIRWIPYAFVRIVLFFMAGICLAIYFPDFLSYRSAVAIFLILVLIYFMISIFLGQHRGLKTLATLKFFSGFTGLTAIFLAGYSNVLVKTDSRKIDHLSKITEPDTILPRSHYIHAKN